MSLVVAWLGAGASLGAPAAPASRAAGATTVPAGVSVHTAHYDVYAERVDAGEVGRMLEAQHVALTAFFGRAPEGRLAVGIYGDAERFRAALLADHQAAVQAGGYYAPGTRKAYLFVQPSEYYTRQLTLHECAHQFHFLVATGNTSPSLFLYSEGLAEQLGMHDWDGQRLRVGVIPAVSLEDYPAQAAAHFTGRLGRNLRGMVRGEVETERPEAWAVVHFLLERYPERYRVWANALNHHASPGRAADLAFESALASTSPAAATKASEGSSGVTGSGWDWVKVAEEFSRWLAVHQQPWEISTVSWQERGDSIEGWSANNTVAIAFPKRQPTRGWTVDCQADHGNAMYGLVVNHRSAEEYELLQVLPAGAGREVRLLRRTGGKWVSEGEWRLPAGEKAGGKVRLGVAIRGETQDERPGETLSLSANGSVLKEIPLEGRVGVHVQVGRVLFWVKEE